MKRQASVTPEFVEFIPDRIAEGTIYISMKFATAVHKCCCGCGNEVVTPFSPTDWTLTFDGVSVSLDPSIVNWSFRCISHYWIRRNSITWADQWSREEIATGRRRDRSSKERYFATEKTADEAPHPDQEQARGKTWQKIRKWWTRRKA